MKLTHATVSIIAAAAVLLSAYAVGLVVRHVRLSHVTQSQAPTEPRPKRTTQPTPEDRAKIKKARQEELEASRNLTTDQKEQYKKDIVDKLTPAEQPDANRPAGRPGRGQARMRMAAMPRPPADANANGGTPADRETTPPQNAVDSASAQDANRPK